MKIHELASSFLDLKTRRNEQERVIQYDLPRKLSDLEKRQDTVDDRLKVQEFKENIQVQKRILEQLDREFAGVREELAPLLASVGASREQPLKIHVHDQIYFNTYLDEDGEVQSPGTYHHIS